MTVIKGLNKYATEPPSERVTLFGAEAPLFVLGRVCSTTI